MPVSFCFMHWPHWGKILFSVFQLEFCKAEMTSNFSFKILSASDFLPGRISTKNDDKVKRNEILPQCGQCTRKTNVAFGSDFLFLSSLQNTSVCTAAHWASFDWIWEGRFSLSFTKIMIQVSIKCLYRSGRSAHTFQVWRTMKCISFCIFWTLVADLEKKIKT